MNIPFPKKGRGGPRKVFPICYICGRQYTNASLPIHEPQCLKKWRNENNKLPRSMRRPEPVKPKPVVIPKEKGLKTSGKYDLKAAEANWQAAQANLSPCAGCGRTFSQDRIQKHQSICVRTGIVPGINQTKPNINPNCEFARRMSYKPVHPNSKMINYKRRGVTSKLGIRARMTAVPKNTRNPTSTRKSIRNPYAKPSKGKPAASPRVVATPRDKEPPRKMSKNSTIPQESPQVLKERSSSAGPSNTAAAKTTPRKLSLSAGPSNRAATKSTVMMKFCPSCGTKFNDKDKFCSNCAAPRKSVS